MTVMVKDDKPVSDKERNPDFDILQRQVAKALAKNFKRLSFEELSTITRHIEMLERTHVDDSAFYRHVIDEIKKPRSTLFMGGEKF